MNKHALLIAAPGPLGRALELALDARGWEITWTQRITDASAARRLRAHVIVVDALVAGDCDTLWTIVRSLAIPVVVHAPSHELAGPVFGLRAACLQVGAADPEALVDAAEMLRPRAGELPVVLPIRMAAGRLTKWTAKLRGPHQGPW